ncbi:hypothetical protein GCM10011519_28710 [Marmoricola endophyticus]|uniref:DivIVA domain-containing protein n=1 Tax=Marmoricola endophyticus TaxID=2040280 RepID=A0A917BNJ0_9ACTN|nr:DivIVA domain-containing protein [Marmoricola endophyticus]GGF53033.1 hypothetical protein GCM10011519_28710 [Marmoricola endophyticus]
MSLLFAVLVVVVIGGIVVVAVGGGGDAVAMREVGVDRSDLRLPEGRPLTAADLRGVRFGTALRGYRASDVDAVLERLARELDDARGPQPTPPVEEPARSPYETPPPAG